MLKEILQTLQIETEAEALNLILTFILSGLIGYVWSHRGQVTGTEKDKVEDGEGLPKLQDGDVSLPGSESVLKLIKDRRSIMPKDLTGEILSDESIEYLLEAGNWAPTHHKTQPWRYTVISGPNNILDYLDFIEKWYSDNRELISEDEFQKFQDKYNSMRETLPANVSHMLVIGMKRQALADKLLPEWEEIAATSCSVQNIHLALTALPGCGGFWSSHTWCKHARDSIQFKEYLGLESEDRVFGAFILGRIRDGAKFKSTRADWRNKVVWRTGS